uniref:Uncharacterized protein n=1 Tax=Glossina pallidipes TaxID=7398 RepID=A0A1A9ZZR5_GLOPL
MFNHIQSGQQSFYNTTMYAVPKRHLDQKIIFLQYCPKKGSPTLADKIGSDINGKGKCSGCNNFLNKALDTKLSVEILIELSYNAFSHIAAGFLIMIGAIAPTVSSLGSSIQSP